LGNNFSALLTCSKKEIFLHLLSSGCSYWLCMHHGKNPLSLVTLCVCSLSVAVTKIPDRANEREELLMLAYGSWFQSFSP
jgi:hypothetical protein